MDQAFLVPFFGWLNIVWAEHKRSNNYHGGFHSQSTKGTYQDPCCWQPFLAARAMPQVLLKLFWRSLAWFRKFIPEVQHETWSRTKLLPNSWKVDLGYSPSVNQGCQPFLCHPWFNALWRLRNEWHSNMEVLRNMPKALGRWWIEQLWFEFGSSLVNTSEHTIHTFWTCSSLFDYPIRHSMLTHAYTVN